MAAPPSVPPKKYSEVSSASHVVRNQMPHPKPVQDEVKPAKKSEVKVGSAVNTQPVADKRKYLDLKFVMWCKERKVIYIAHY